MPRKKNPTLFEDSLGELEQLVEQMEQGDISLEESLKENLFEVMNIGSRLFLTDLTPHLKHRDVEQATALPDDVMTFIQDKNDISVKQLHIELPKYGEGYLTLINR